jgi:hypothetical protein
MKATPATILSHTGEWESHVMSDFDWTQCLKVFTKHNVQIYDSALKLSVEVFKHL